MSIKKKILAVLLCALTAGSVMTMTSCGKDKEESVGFSVEENAEIMNYTAPKNGDKVIEITFKDYGTVKFRLFPEYAEKGVENFTKLAESGYYDGLTFHRIIQDFMIQGGDPLGTGGGGESAWGGKFDGGVNGHLIHVPGAVAYANSGGTDTNGSQFYIVTGYPAMTDAELDSMASYGIELSENQRNIYKEVGGTPDLDGGYTVFGQVYDGLDVIFTIQSTATDANDAPLNKVIVESVKVTEYNGEELKWRITDYDWHEPTPVNYTEPQIGEKIVSMKIKDYGTVKFKLFPEYLPNAAENFFQLAESGYYDGLTFHRVINNFMIQGGDPLGTGMGGESAWGGSFDGGTYSSLLHTAGALCYANSGSTATNGSQFYIVTGMELDESIFANASGYSDSKKETYIKAGYGYPYLDGNYTVFGQVIDGLDVVFKIQQTETGDSDKPLNDVIIESVTVEEYDGSPVKWFISDYDMTEPATDAPTESTADEDTDAETTDGETEETETAPEESAE